jgi:hypothetical protein
MFKFSLSFLQVKMQMKSFKGFFGVGLVSNCFMAYNFERYKVDDDESSV